MNFYNKCLDMSVPVEERLEALSGLESYQKDEIIEQLCSAYNIHQTSIYFEYLHALILSPMLSLKRRVRVGEICDMGTIVLYLLTRLPFTERIGCIEMFQNPYLKHHAYVVLFSFSDDIGVRIQVMKNVWRLEILKKFKFQFLEWFSDRLTDTIPYQHKANCADFILINSPNTFTENASNFLGIKSISNPLEHKESVHLFNVTPEFILQLRSTNTKTTPKDILDFAIQHRLNYKFLEERIFVDKTLVNGITLSELICKIWDVLTDDLRLLCLRDILASGGDGWSCTTGYFIRMINIYQTTCNNTLLSETEITFSTIVFKIINRHLFGSEQKEDILMELPNNTEETRIKYLTFKVHTLPKLITELKLEFQNLSQETFDEYFSKAIRAYENANYG